MLNGFQILYSLFAVAVILFLCYFTSKVISWGIQLKKTKKNSIDIFWMLFLGLFFWTSIYAIALTKGLSILLPLPFLIVWLFNRLLKTEHKKYESFNNEIYFILSTIIAQFLFFVWTLTSFSPDTIKYIAGDFSIYYRMSERLNTYGVEAYNFNLLFNNSHLPGPYHYGDLWLYAAISRFVSTNPSVLFLTAFTILSFTFTMGLRSYCQLLFNQWLPSGSKWMYLLIASGLFAGFQYFFPNFILPSAEPYTLSIFNWGKIMVLSCSLVGILIVIWNKQWTILAGTIVISGLLYINSAPAIYGGAFLLMLLLLIKKQVNFKTFLSTNAIYLLLTLIPVLILYKIIPLLGNAVAEHKPNTFLHGETAGRYLKTTVNIFIGGWFQLFTLLPYFLILFAGLWIQFGVKKIFPQILKLDYSIVFLIFVFTCGLGSWAILHPVSVDTVQFFHNILAPVYAITISIIVLFTVIAVRKIYLTLFIVTFAIVSIYFSCQYIFFAWSFDKEEWNKMQTYFKDESDATPFINLRSFNELNYWSAKKTDQYIPLNILTYQWPSYHNVSLNAPFIALTPNSIYAFEEEKDIVGASFTTYCNKFDSAQAKNFGFIVNKFVEDFKIKYVSVSLDTTLPDYLRTAVKDSLLLKKSNFTIYRLK